MTSLSNLFPPWIQPAGITPLCPHLWILVNFLRVLLVAVYVEPDGCSSTACTAETENDPRTVGEDDSEALGERKRNKDVRDGDKFKYRLSSNMWLYNVRGGSYSICVCTGVWPHQVFCQLLKRIISRSDFNMESVLNWIQTLSSIWSGKNNNNNSKTWGKRSTVAGYCVNCGLQILMGSVLQAAHLVFGNTPIDRVCIGKIVSDGHLVGLIARWELLSFKGRIEHCRLQILHHLIGSIWVNFLIVVPGSEVRPRF